MFVKISELEKGDEVALKLTGEDRFRLVRLSIVEGGMPRTNEVVGEYLEIMEFSSLTAQLFCQRNNFVLHQSIDAWIKKVLAKRRETG